MNRSIAVSIMFGFALTLAGCAPAGLSKEEAVEALRNAHSDCELGLPDDTLSEPPLEDERVALSLRYTIERGKSKSLVKCVSLTLFGEDITLQEFSENELALIENAYGYATSTVFHTGMLYGWDKPFDFVREGMYGSSRYSFVWWENGERQSIENKK